MRLFIGFGPMVEQLRARGKLAAMARAAFRRLEHGDKAAWRVLENAERQVDHAFAWRISGHTDSLGRPCIYEFRGGAHENPSSDGLGSQDGKGIVESGNRRR